MVSFQLHICILAIEISRPKTFCSFPTPAYIISLRIHSFSVFSLAMGLRSGDTCISFIFIAQKHKSSTVKQMLHRDRNSRIVVETCGKLLPRFQSSIKVVSERWMLYKIRTIATIPPTHSMTCWPVTGARTLRD